MTKKACLYNPLVEDTEFVDFEPIRVYIRDPIDKGIILRSNTRDELFLWCRQNCRGRYWIGMGFGQFELEDDAILFSLCWDRYDRN